MDRLDWVRWKRNPIFLVLLVTVSAIATGWHLLFESASAQNQPLVQQSLTKQSRRPPRDPRGPGIPGGGQARPQQPPMPRQGVPGGGNLYDDILNKLREQNRIGVRGGNLCAIAPPARLTGSGNAIWHDRPLFIWQGAAVRIELLDSITQEVLWSKNLTPSDTTAAYDREPLQASRRYEWRLYRSLRDPEVILFRILPQQERDRITTQLNQIQVTGATAEQIALQRANYFAENLLWADALQEIYSVQNPSAQLTKLSQEITNYICR